MDNVQKDDNCSEVPRFDTITAVKSLGLIWHHALVSDGLDKGLGRPQSWPGCSREEKIAPALRRPLSLRYPRSRLSSLLAEQCLCSYQ
jgi:hypothetical protein